ncbi:YetF domain-containing protein [Halanaerobaculum tunisiense]
MEETIVVITRGIISFFTLLIFTRILGKHQISQLTYFDYIAGITIGSIAGSLTTQLNTNAWPHWVGLATWTGLSLIVEYISIKWRQASKYLNGEPTIVIMNGKIMEEAMKKMRYRVTDLMSQLRTKGVFNLSQVEFAILETNGKLSVLKKSQHQTLTPKDMNLTTDYSGLSIELIHDGVIMEQNLKQVNLDRPWLQAQLRKLNITDISEVVLATLNTTGSLYVDTKKDQTEIPIDISDYPGAN